MRFPHEFDELPERGFLLANKETAQGGTAFEGPCKLSTFDVGDLQGLFCVLKGGEQYEIEYIREKGDPGELSESPVLSEQTFGRIAGAAA